jgi:hypothetical protein
MGGPLRLSSSVPIGMSALSAEHFTLRQLSTRPLGNASRAAWARYPSRPTCSAAAKTSGLTLAAVPPTVGGRETLRSMTAESGHSVRRDRQTEPRFDLNQHGPDCRGQHATAATKLRWLFGAT